MGGSSEPSSFQVEPSPLQPTYPNRRYFVSETPPHPTPKLSTTPNPWDKVLVSQRGQDGFAPYPRTSYSPRRGVKTTCPLLLGLSALLSNLKPLAGDDDGIGEPQLHRGPAAARMRAPQVGFGVAQRRVNPEHAKASPFPHSQSEAQSEARKLANPHTFPRIHTSLHRAQCGMDLYVTPVGF